MWFCGKRKKSILNFLKNMWMFVLKYLKVSLSKMRRFHIAYLTFYRPFWTRTSAKPLLQVFRLFLPIWSMKEMLLIILWISSLRLKVLNSKSSALKPLLWLLYIWSTNKIWTHSLNRLKILVSFWVSWVKKFLKLFIPISVAL